MVNGLEQWLGNTNMFDNQAMNNKQDINQQFQKFQSSRFHFASNQSQSIILTTDEGDKITINSSRASSIDYMSYDYTKNLKNKMMTIQEEKGKVLQSSSFEISIEGDLNEEEKADIQGILKDLDNVMKDLKNGNLYSVLKNSTKLLENKETLSSLNAVLQFSQEVEIEERQMIKTTHRPPNKHAMENKSINLLDLIERVTDKVKDYLEKAEESQTDINNFIKQFFSKLYPEQQQPLENPKTS